MKKPDERLRGVSIEGPCACGSDGEPTCVGAYEGGPVSLGCDGCCGHGNEDGWCVVLADERRARELAQARAEGFRAARERAAELVESADDGVPLQMLADESIRAMEDAGEGGEALSQLRAATERMEAVANPTPAAMLGEAVEHIRRAETLLLAVSNSGNDIVVERALEDLEEALVRVDGLRQDTERVEGQG